MVIKKENMRPSH